MTAGRPKRPPQHRGAMGRGSVPSAAEGGHSPSRPGLAPREMLTGEMLTGEMLTGPCRHQLPSDGARLHVDVHTGSSSPGQSSGSRGVSALVGGGPAAPLCSRRGAGCACTPCCAAPARGPLCWQRLPINQPDGV